MPENVWRLVVMGVPRILLRVSVDAGRVGVGGIGGIGGMYHCSREEVDEPAGRVYGGRSEFHIPTRRE